jgi:hypothetical protein
MGERRLCTGLWVTEVAVARRGLDVEVVWGSLAVAAWLGLFRGRELLGLVVMAALLGLPFTRGDVV